MDFPVNESQENRQSTSSNDDILARRLKNRERQRRYRERKRLEADTKKVMGTNQAASLQVEVPVSVAPQDNLLLQVNVAPQETAIPGNVCPMDSAVPASVVPLDYVMPVNVASGELMMPVSVASGELMMPVTRASQDAVTRVYSGRKWKSDARKVHAVRQKEVSSNVLVSPHLTSTGGSQTSLPHVEQLDVTVSNVISLPVTSLENNGTPKSIPSRRHWKAEARNKKS